MAERVMSEKKEFSAWNPAIAVPFIKSNEGCRLVSYRDPAGVWTIGYGSTRLVSGEKVIAGLVITQKAADALLDHHLRELADDMAAFVRVPVTRNSFIALVDFAYNCGLHAFEKSTLLAELNARNYQGARAEFGKWVYAGGQKLPGLVKRRADEARIFHT